MIAIWHLHDDSCKCRNDARILLIFLDMRRAMQLPENESPARVCHLLYRSCINRTRIHVPATCCTKGILRGPFRAPYSVSRRHKGALGPHKWFSFVGGRGGALSRGPTTRQMFYVSGTSTFEDVYPRAGHV